MAYTVDWLTKVITVPAADMTLVSGTRYQLYMFDFLIECRRLESDFDEGLWADQIVDHANTRVDFAGADYAPFDEIINGYVVQFSGVVTRVDLVGSNNNVVDIFVSAGVSVVPSNSAGLISDLNSLSAIAHMSFNNRVSINANTGDSIAGFTGDPTLLGNGQFPVNNIADAHIIAEREGFNIFYLETSLTIANESLTDGYVIRGNGANIVVLTLDQTADVTNCQFENLTLAGDSSGNHIVRESLINGVSEFDGIIYNCGFTINPLILSAGTTDLFDCKSAVPGANARPQIDFNDDVGNLAARNWVGGLELVNKSQAVGDITIDMLSGITYIRSSCTAGTITLRGVGVYVDESGAGCTVNTDGLLDPSKVNPNQVWDTVLEAGFTAAEIIRVMAAALAGKADGATTGTMRFRDLADSKDRITSDVDGTGNRSAVTVDGS